MPCITLFGGPLHLKKVDCPDHLTAWTGVADCPNRASAGTWRFRAFYYRNHVLFSGKEMDVMVFDTNDPDENFKLTEEAREWAIDQILQGFQAK